LQEEEVTPPEEQEDTPSEDEVVEPTDETAPEGDLESVSFIDDADILEGKGIFGSLD
jgi:hypothetical protein